MIVCDEGYASSLAAAGLADLGLINVTDLLGGFQAWQRYRGPGGRAARIDGRVGRTNRLDQLIGRTNLKGRTN